MSETISSSLSSPELSARLSTSDMSRGARWYSSHDGADWFEFEWTDISDIVKSPIVVVSTADAVLCPLPPHRTSGTRTTPDQPRSKIWQQQGASEAVAIRTKSTTDHALHPCTRLPRRLSSLASPTPHLSFVSVCLVRLCHSSSHGGPSLLASSCANFAPRNLSS